MVGAIDRNIPLTGSLIGPFSSHVDVVCGYNAGPKVFYVRDATGAGVTVTQSVFSERTEKIALDPDADATSRFRSLLSLDPDRAEPVFEQLFEKEGDEFGNFARLHVEMIREQFRGNRRSRRLSGC